MFIPLSLVTTHLYRKVHQYVLPATLATLDPVSCHHLDSAALDSLRPGRSRNARRNQRPNSQSHAVSYSDGARRHYAQAAGD